MNKLITLRPIGTVSSTRDTPIDDDWDAIPAHIDLDTDQFTAEALMCLDAFSHCEIIFLFDRVPDEKIETGARHPRGREDWPRIGIFAQRGKNRPNRIGLTTC
ncbi:MAG TPA: tRNA (N6-threonylcarbamoyladenosine(37)-N6)-methyltransferase TrmO, partial [Hyphomonas adhaerens]|nr:tRNA (N6-threonylcarbamoyladenosine(37)-N6)-methyltransferase TrmO [Hyphomonas adhaerens]